MPQVRVIIENRAPENGIYLTPVWLGFHDGSFDLFDSGAPASRALEVLAEVAGTTLLNAAISAIPGGVFGTVDGPFAVPLEIDPGERVAAVFDLDPAANTAFTYASMIIPSNDAFIGNGQPIELFDAAGAFVGPIDLALLGSSIYDAGTEQNTETGAAFINQTATDRGLDENGVVHVHPGFIGSQGNPGTGGSILGGTTRAGTFVDPVAADFTRPGYEVAGIHVNLVETQTGTNGDDLLTGTGSDDILSGLSGDDTLAGNGGFDDLIGGPGNDLLLGGAGEDLLEGGGGNDTLAGGFGFDTLNGGGGTDTADLGHTSAAADIDLAAGQVVFGGGVEILIGIENAIGTNGDNVITGTGGANRLEGGAGNDTLIGGFGFDTLDGGAGTDTADLSHTSAAVDIDLDAGEAVFGGGVEILIGIENVIGTNGNNFITGTGGANRLEGGGGDDTLKGGWGFDTLDGGEGTDTADLSHTGAAVDIDLEAGLVLFGGGVEILIGIENVIGTNGANFINGTGGANRLEGGGGDDTLKGGYGFDTLDGGAGTDTADLSHTSADADIDLAAGQVVFGGGVETLIAIENAIGTEGDNVMIGTSGANTLEGGGGDDTLQGNGGPDRFVFGGTAFDRDVIADFALGTDTIVFDGVGGVTDADDPTYTVGDFDGVGSQDIRITFNGLGGDLLGERIDVLGVGPDIEALKTDILFA